MDDDLKRRLSSGDLWMRALYMVIFAIAYTIAETVLVLVAVFQFLTILFTGSANAAVLRFGSSLASYQYQILSFETFNTEVRPFPFADWPEPTPGGARWMEDAAPDDDSEQPLARVDSEEPAGAARRDTSEDEPPRRE